MLARYENCEARPDLWGLGCEPATEEPPHVGGCAAMGWRTYCLTYGNGTC